jgi:SAM-dependent methyltransferase
MKPMIHVLKVTANAQDAEGADAETRHSLIVFVKCEDEGSAYAPADAHLRQARRVAPKRLQRGRSSWRRCGAFEIVVNPSDDPAKRKHHWERFWSTSEPRNASWYQDSPEASLHLINATRVSRDARILDVGGGASTLVDGLLDRGFENISVLDLSDSAIAHAKERLGARSEKVAWITGDVTAFHADTPIDLWHDRAVLHFLTEKPDRDTRSLPPLPSTGRRNAAASRLFATDLERSARCSVRVSAFWKPRTKPTSPQPR